jgi:hypothetical protein
MPAFHRNALVAVLLAAASSVEGFAPVGSTGRIAAPLANANDGSRCSSTTALSAIDPSAIVPIAMFGSAVFATVQFSDKETSVADVIAKKAKKKESSSGSSGSSTATATATIEKEPAVVETVPEEPAAPVMNERKYEFTTPATKRKKEAEAAREEAPAPEPKAAAPANKDISEIRNEVASTLDSRKEMQKRLDDAKASRDAAKSKEVEAAAAVEAVEEEVAEEDDASEEKVAGRKRQFAGKIVKKVVMPWKKWSSL